MTEPYNSLTDEELVSLAAKGDKAATDTLIGRYSGAVARRASGFSGSGVNHFTALDRDDFIQYGLLGLCSAIRTYRGDRNTVFSTYANTCIRNAMITALKKHSRGKEGIRYQDLMLDGAENGDATSSAESEYISLERVREIENIIHTALSETEKQVLQYHISGMTYKEIAGLTGRTAKAVDGALQRARKKIAAKIGDMST